MFGLSFGELMVIGVVALIVVGPERLPKLAQTVGLLMGRAQRYVNDLKSDLEKEINVDELKKMKEDVSSSASNFEDNMRANLDQIKEPFAGVKGQSDDLEKQLKKGFDNVVNDVKGKKSDTKDANTDDAVGTSTDKSKLPSPSSADKNLSSKRMHDKPTQASTSANETKTSHHASETSSVQASTSSSSEAQAPKDTAVTEGSSKTTTPQAETPSESEIKH